MKKNRTYRLIDAITRKATGKRLNLMASRVRPSELVRNKRYFKFDFMQQLKENYIIYKFYTQEQPNFIQRLVAVKATPGILDCKNIEINKFNKNEAALYNEIGKAIVAFCCKYSLDHGMEGDIFFDTGNRLIPYYEMLGDRPVAGLKMAITSPESLKLIDRYFKFS